MRDHTVFAIVLLVFAVGFYSFNSGVPTGQAYGVYTTGEYYTGSVNTYKSSNFDSNNNYPLLGNPSRVMSLFEGEIKLDRSTIQDCIYRAIDTQTNEASFKEAELQFKLAGGVCKGVSPEDLDINKDGVLSRQDVDIANAYYSKNVWTKGQKEKLNNVLLCGWSNEGKTIWSGPYKRILECTNLNGYKGFDFVKTDLFAYL